MTLTDENRNGNIPNGCVHVHSDLFILLKAFCFYFYHWDLFPLADRQDFQKKFVTINDTQERREFCLWQETNNKVNYAIKENCCESLYSAVF